MLIRLTPLILLVACGQAPLDLFEACAIELTLDTTSGVPGDTVTAVGGPLTRPYDTVVAVGGVVAENILIERSSQCASCDTCRVEAGCLPCGLCPDCDGDPHNPEATGVCGQCEESLSFEVPQLDPGATAVVVTNRNGTSRTLAFEISGGTSGETGASPHTGDTVADTASAETADTAETETADTASTSTTSPAGTADTASTSTTSPTGTTGTTGETGSGTGSTGTTGSTGVSETGAQTTGTTGHTGQTGGTGP